MTRPPGEPKPYMKPDAPLSRSICSKCSNGSVVT
ncbi:Uncharacterised protein [Bordetella pertussis]|nr:Uncharacterised protein [Bordetella pertussis]CFW48139.1 Uncharacterised protein [Bordetella pertussis]